MYVLSDHINKLYCSYMVAGYNGITYIYSPLNMINVPHPDRHHSKY